MLDNNVLSYIDQDVHKYCKSNAFLNFSSISISILNQVTMKNLTESNREVDGLFLAFPIDKKVLSTSDPKDDVPTNSIIKHNVMKFKLPTSCKFLWILDYANDLAQKWIRRMPLLIDPNDKMAMVVDQLLLPNKQIKDYMLLRWKKYGI
jgi:hypothetical protein